MPMRFKVGDKVRIKPFSEIHLDSTNHDPESQVRLNTDMKVMCGAGETFTIVYVDDNFYHLENTEWVWADAWLEPAESEVEQDIMPGYAVKKYYVDGTSMVYLATMRHAVKEKPPEVVIVSRNGGWDLASKKTDILYGSVIKVEVYGYCDFACNSLRFCTDDRPLLWTWEKEKPAPKKMTVAEICKELGYDVEIVKEGESHA